MLNETRNTAVFSELCGHPLHVNRVFKVLKYWSLILKNKITIAPAVYKPDFNDYSKGYYTYWASKVKKNVA